MCEAPRPAATATTSSGDEPPGFDSARLERMGVQFAAIAPGRAATTIDLVGDLQLNRERLAEVASHAAGRVASVHASVGQHVRRGDVLLTVESGAVSDAIAQQWTRVAELHAAERQLVRMERLFGEGAAAAHEVDVARAAKRVAEANLAASSMRLRTLGVDRAASMHEEAGRAPLRAPIDGTVIERRVVLGSWIEPTEEAFVIADLSTLWAELGVFESDLGELHEGDPASIDVPALGLLGLHGTVELINAQVDRATRMGRIRIVVPNADGRLRAGLSLAAHVPVQGGDRRALSVPLESVRTHDAHPAVLVRRGPRAVWTPVEVGQRYGASVVVRSGIAPGDDVAVSGLGLLAAAGGV